jgi:hypothetical protein
VRHAIASAGIGSWLAVAAAATLVSCASGAGSRPVGSPEVAADGQVWPVKTREHVDLWLHGFAMLKPDSARIPYFRTGYRDELGVHRIQNNVTTKLDENRDKLLERLSTSPGLENSQFLAIYFGNWREMKSFLDMFLAVDGDPRRASNPNTQDAIGIIASYFRLPGDREWARLFVQSLDDEYNKFYRDYWAAETASRAATLAAVDSLWQRVYYPKFKRYLEGSQQRRGDLLLSMPLNGEGRLLPGSATSPGGNYSYLAVNFPARADDALHVIYTFAHEVSGKVVNVAVSDHTTPAQQRAGEAQRYEIDGLVVGGYLLIKRIAPDIAEGYARHYLAEARVRPGGNSAEESLLSAFPLPKLILESISKQIDAVMSGI